MTAPIWASAVLAFVDGAEEQFGGLHSFMLLRHGEVAAEGWWAPYAPDHPHMLFSLSKSFTSTAVGMAVAEGLLTVDDPVLSFFPDDAPAEIGENLAALRVRHLLSMSTGQSTEPSARHGEANWVRAFLAHPVEHAPGTRFHYNSLATYMLSAIVQRRTGETLLQYLGPRLFEPLGIRDPTWESCPCGINVGGWGLSVRTDAIARFGQLYLRKGEWNGRRLLPESWIEEATRVHVSNGSRADSDWEQGYGYQFWRCRHGAYRGDGAFGQYCVVMPAQDAVLAITSGVRDMQAVLNLVWEHLLPALDSSESGGPDAAADLMIRKLASLSLRPPQGSPSSPTAARVSGRTFVFEPNDEGVRSITSDFGGEGCTLTLVDARGAHALECGEGRWTRGTTTLDHDGPRPAAAAGAWTADDTYEAQICFYETPFLATITCRFDGDRLVYERKMNVGFGPTDRPQLVARAG